MFNTYRGDMFAIEADVYAHGVNCQSNMDHGVAAIIRNRWPEVFEEYCYRCEEGDLVPGEHTLITAVDGTRISNIASQDLPGANASMEWLESGLDLMYGDLLDAGYQSVSLPLIGGGIGGLDPDQCKATIKRYAEKYPGIDTTLCLI